MKQLLLLFVFFTFFGCQSEKSKRSLNKITENFYPVLIDTIGINKTNFIFESDDERWMTEANYAIYYIGPKKDTLFMYPLLGFIYPPPPPPPGHEGDYTFDSGDYTNPNESYLVDFFEKSYRRAADSKTEIRVDTTARIGNAFTVYLTNKSADTIAIGFGERIPLLLEALDSTGTWKPIQERFYYMCGTGLSTVILPPNEIAITFVPIFKGNYKTKLRLTDSSNHSQPFEGHLFYTQFQSVFDEQGNYNKAYLEDKKRRKGGG